MLPRILLVMLSVYPVAVHAEIQSFDSPDTVVVPSGALQLRALVWHPSGNDPFPAVLFNHGRGLTPKSADRVQSIKQVGHLFAGHGYVFMALFRRGEDLSVDQGTFIGDLLDQERVANGVEAAQALQVQLLESDHLNDALAGLAFLRRLPEVDPRRVAVVGHSFGGSLSLLVAERDDSLRAVVDFAGAANSWAGSARLRERLVAAVGRLTVPVLFVYAENDFSIAPGKVLAAEMTRHSLDHQLKVFPAFGKTADEGHGFVYLGMDIWERDLFSFLENHLKP